ncbi:TPA: transferrin-binding protein-like solute binding protein, partial [Mannheimia haemolytica]|nr:transferrin-binding protein-like solute binding protein [Mannheimia haemolytica]
KKTEEDKKAEEAKKIAEAKGIGNKEYKDGLNELEEKNETGKNGEEIRTYGYLYNSHYSVVTAKMKQTLQENGRQMEPTVEVKGLKTENLPTEGKATYKGEAFDSHGNNSNSVVGGELIYNVDFSSRTGSGLVKNVQGGSIELAQGEIKNDSIIASAHQKYNDQAVGNGSYNIQFFGPNAEEIGGKIELNGEGEGSMKQMLGIAGTREEQK